MKTATLRETTGSWVLRTVIVAVVLGIASPGWGYSPTDPKVQELVGKARQFLAKSNGSRMGEWALIGMALIKSGSDDSDPKVQEAVAAIRKGLQNQEQLGRPVNYNVAVSIIFLVENDPVKYRAEIQSLLDILLGRQEGHGGWSYWPGEGSHSREEGDSSMTQYATLALWEAKRAKFNVPQDAAERVANFWMRTQTPQGAWGYQGRVAPLGQRAQQAEVRPSIAVAGLSSCYVIGDLFGMAQKRESPSNSGVSSALQKVQDKKEDAGRNFPASGVNVDLMRQTMQLGDRYLDGTYRGYAADTWVIYYMYATERYRSFQELYTGQTAPSPKWYNDGVDFLAKTQAEDGSWKQHMSGAVDTSFAVLFLTRSTKKSIEREFGLGLVRGGRGLPADIENVAIDQKTGDVINPEAAGTVAQLMSILEDPKNANFDSVAANPGKLIEALVRPGQDEDQVAREQRIERLKQMVSKGEYQQRLVAVKALSRTGDLDKVPLLLYALTDPDPRVMNAADQGLRFISRKFNGFGSLDEAKPEQVEKIRLQWKQWFLALRPDAELLE